MSLFPFSDMLAHRGFRGLDEARILSSAFGAANKYCIFKTYKQEKE